MIKCKINQLLVVFLLLLPCLAYALPGSHDPDTGVGGIVCNDCHVYPNTIGNTDAKDVSNLCYRCHKNGSTSRKFSANDFADIDNTSSVGGRTAPKNTSHKWLGSDVNVKAKAKIPVDTTAGGLNKRGLTGALSCVRCHSVHGTSGTTSNVAPYPRFPNDKDEMCMNCHIDRANSTAILGSHPVAVSYTSASVKAKAGQFVYSGANRNPYRNVVNPTAEMKNKKGFVVCTSCHGVHVADSNSSTPDTFYAASQGQLSTSDGSLLRVSRRGADNSLTTVNICTNCHIKQHSGQMKQHTKSVVIQCVDCHNAHVDTILASDPVQTPNKYLLRRYVNYSGVKNNVVQLSTYRKRLVYTEYTSTGKWARSDSTGVCQACHALPSTVPDHTVYTSRTTCQACHTTAPHTDTTAQGGCTTCHGTPPVDPGTTANATDYGGSTYTGNEATAPHSTHASGGSKYAFACNQCHNGYDTVPSKHQSGLYNDGVFVTKVAVGTDGIISGSAASYSGGDCTAVYCHSDGTSTTSLGSPKTETWAGGLNHITTCDACHALTPATGSHTKHTSATLSYGCVTCHAGTVSDNSTISGKSKHVNAVKDIQFSGTTPAVGTTCANVYCHSDGKGNYSAPTLTNWANNTGGACGSCHATSVSGTFAANSDNVSHATHFTVTSDSSNASCNKCHTYNGELVSPHVNGTINVNYDGTGCAKTTGCHGTITYPAWGNNTTNTTCTKCHGTGTVTVTAANRYVVAPSDAAGVGTGKVSANAKTGAHETHLKYLNGFSNYSTVDYRCNACHGTLPAAGTHSDGTSTPVFQKIANNWGVPGTVPSFSSGTCSNTYCHDPSQYNSMFQAGANTTPGWVDATYLSDDSGDGVKNVTNCGKCHKVPGIAGFSKQSVHGAGMVTNAATDCANCHGHNGDDSGEVVGRRHIDGLFYAGGCNSCHGYPPMSADEIAALSNGNFADARLKNYSAGAGKHRQHLNPAIRVADGFTPCLPCHPDESSSVHNQGSGTVLRANVNVNLSSDTGYRFDDTRSKRYNSTTRTCSNVGCHFQPSPAW